MDEQVQLFKLCGVCGHKREYIEFHRLYNACIKCTAKR